MGLEIGRRLLPMLRVGVASLSIFALLRWVDWGSALAAIGASDWRYVTVSALLVYVDRYLMASKWAMLLRIRNIPLSNLEALRICLASTFAGMFLPMSVGADMVKLTRTTLSTGKGSHVAASILMERALGLLAMSTLAVVGLLFLVLAGDNRLLPIFYSACLALIGIVIVLLVSLRRALWAWVCARLLRFSRHRLVRLLIDFHQVYIEFGGHRNVLVVFFLLSFLQHTLGAVIVFCGGLALGFSMGFLYFMALIPVISLVGMMPISIGGIGVREALYVLFFALVGLSSEQSLSLSLLMRAVGCFVLVPGALLFLQDALRLRRG
jgi:uncharacterized protein (TIRG00374 family)